MTWTKSENKPRSEFERAHEEDRKTAAFVVFLYVLAISTCAFIVFGCASVVHPERVEARQASFDGNEQTSGILSSTPSGFVVTDHFRERHNAMIATYGGDFIPALKPDHGIAPMGGGRWLISKEGMTHFLEMNAWRRAGLKPKNQP
jgi:hypothetical protein